MRQKCRECICEKCTDKDSAACFFGLDRCKICTDGNIMNREGCFKDGENEEPPVPVDEIFK